MSTSAIAEPFALNLSTSPGVAKRPRTASVSVIIPCYNEERFIGKALEDLANQYPADAYEIVIVDGMSDDGTRNEIARFQSEFPAISVRLIENPARNIPRSLNIGIAAARGDIIARIDAHAAPSSGYIRRCVDVLNSGAAEVVGMPCRVQPGADTTLARAIASGVSHPFGIGDAKYRLASTGESQQEVDTVAFACFRKSLWSELGGYDEELLTNEDYDFNYRVRRRGQRVVLDTAEHCNYFRARDFENIGCAVLAVWFVEGAHGQAATAFDQSTAFGCAFIRSFNRWTCAGRNLDQARVATVGN